jgi:multidrug efflux pump subunit AcrA (membrane-fusion protein)
VTRIHRFAGEIVKPGEVLFTFKLLSETLQLAQTELYKASQEIKLNLEQKKRLSLSGAVPEARLIEIDNQLSRLNVTVKAYRQELQNRGLSPEQIEGVMEGKFVSEISVEVPSVHERNLKEPSRKVPSQDEHDGFFEIQELRVEVGQQVEAGHKLMLLANHQLLAFEGRAFQPELPQIERAIRERWPIEIESPEVASSDWPPFERNLSIRYLANTVDPVSRTFAFTIPFDNPYRTLERDGRTVMFWRFRPGQRVKLSIRIEKLDDVIVLPREAVVREGAEVYVFRQNGDSFSRKPVHLLYEEADRMILANDFSIPPGVFVAQNGAPQMNRMLKAQSSSLPKGFHIHADGSVHMGDH